MPARHGAAARLLRRARRRLPRARQGRRRHDGRRGGGPGPDRGACAAQRGARPRPARPARPAPTSSRRSAASPPCTRRAPPSSTTPRSAGRSPTRCGRPGERSGSASRSRPYGRPVDRRARSGGRRTGGTGERRSSWTGWSPAPASTATPWRRWCRRATGDVRIVPFRGEYHRLRPAARDRVRGLVYPVPDPRYPFLGIHLTRTVDDEVLVGPNAVLALSRDGYRWRDVDLRDLREVLAWPGTRRLAARHWRTGVRELAGSVSRRRFAAEAAPLPAGADGRRPGAGPSGVRAQAVGAGRQRWSTTSSCSGSARSCCCATRRHRARRRAWRSPSTCSTCCRPGPASRSAPPSWSLRRRPVRQRGRGVSVPTARTLRGAGRRCGRTGAQWPRGGSLGWDMIRACACWWPPTGSPVAPRRSRPRPRRPRRWPRAGPAARRTTSVDLLPLSDGGPGFLDVLHPALGGDLSSSTVHGPLGEPVPAAGPRRRRHRVRRGRGGRRAAPGRPAPDRDPAGSSTEGVGELRRRRGGHRRRPGRRRGGRHGHHRRRSRPGRRPGRARRRPGLVEGVELVAATATDAPLMGHSGAAHGFAAARAPTGATREALETSLREWATATDGGLAVRPGAGAGGGIGFGLLLLGAERVNGTAAGRRPAGPGRPGAGRRPRGDRPGGLRLGGAARPGGRRRGPGGPAGRPADGRAGRAGRGRPPGAVGGRDRRGVRGRGRPTCRPGG